MQESIDIVMLAYNRLDKLKESVEAIKKFTRYPYRLIIVDNGSTKSDIKEFIKKNADVPVFLKENLGCAAGYNRGFEYVKSDWWIRCDSDIIVFDNWLTKIMEYKNKYEKGELDVKE